MILSHLSRYVHKSHSARNCLYVKFEAVNQTEILYLLYRAIYSCNLFDVRIQITHSYR